MQQILVADSSHGFSLPLQDVTGSASLFTVSV